MVACGILVKIRIDLNEPVGRVRLGVVALTVSADVLASGSFF